MADLPNIDSLVEEAKSQNTSTYTKGFEDTLAQQLPDIDALVSEAKYGDRPIASTAAGLARGASIGLSDPLLINSGLVDQETLQGLQKENPVASIGAEVVGTIAPAFIPGGQAAPAGALFKLSGGLTKAAAKAVQQSGRGKFAKAVIEKMGPEVLGSAVEGAALGTGKLISEDALGNAEFNGQNLAAHMGFGAALGGAAGATIGLAKVALPGVKGALGAVTSKAGRKIRSYTSADDSFKDLLQISQAAAVKESKKNPNFINDGIKHLKDDLDLATFKTADDLATRNELVLQRSGQAIEDTLVKMDEASLKVGYVPDRASLFNNMKQKLTPYLDETVAGETIAKADLKKLAEYEDLLDLYSKRKDPLTFKELTALKRKLDDKARFDLTKSSFEMDIASDLRTAVRDEVNVLGAQLDDRLKSAGITDYSNLVEDLKKANKSYFIGKSLDPYLKKKAGKEGSASLFTLRDILFAAAGSSIDPVIGAATVAGKALNSDFRRKLVILADIERANQQTAKLMKTTAKDFTSKVSNIKRPAKNSIKVLNSSQLSVDETGAAPKTRRAAYNNLRKRVNERIVDLDAQTRQIALNTGAVARVAPNTAIALGDTMARALTFLHTKMPQDSEGYEDQFFKRDYQPSDYELAQFERYLQVIEAPLTVTEELLAGTMTQEHVEALQEVYPALYQDLVQNLTEELVKQPKLSYSKKVQIALLFGIPADESMRGSSIVELQTIFADQQREQENSIAPTAGAAQKINVASREATDITKAQASTEV